MKILNIAYKAHTGVVMIRDWMGMSSAGSLSGLLFLIDARILSHRLEGTISFPFPMAAPALE